MRRLRLLPLLMFSALSVAPTYTAIAEDRAAAVRIVNAVDERQLLTLKGTVHPLATAKNDRGAAPDLMQLERMHLVLQRSSSQESALKQLIADMHTPGKASYHKWLTPDAFGKQFGPSDQDIQTVETWLTGHGFTVAKVNAGKQTIEFTGNVKQFREAFHAQIHKYEVNGETRFANSSDPQIPSALAPVVGGFASLNNFRLKSFARYMGKASYNPQTDKAIPAWTYGTSAGVNLVVAPGDFAVEYDLNPLYTAGLQGAGQSIAIIDYSNVNVNLVNQFRTLFGLPVNPPQVIIDGNDPGIDGINDPEGPAFGTSIESYLDVEWAGAVAPLATIDLVVAADTQLESGGFLAAEHAVYGNVAPILSSSIYQYGCEQEAGSGNQFIASLWEQAAAQGITVLEAAGDSGSAGCDSDSEQYATDGLGVNNWASTPYNVAVGGTDFYYTDWATGANGTIGNYWDTTPTQSPAVSLKKYLPEQPWNDSQYGLDALSLFNLTGSTSIAGGSGGASNCATGTDSGSSGWATCTAGWPKPSWQTGTGVPSDTVRDIPDVSLYAADGANYSFYPICAQDGDCRAPSGSNLVQVTGVGGTSAATPSFAGIMALVNEKYGTSQGQAGYVLYPLKKQFPASFHDVTVGTNSEPCATGTDHCIAVTDPITDSDGTVEGQLGTGTTPDYNAAAGYNLATGLGTIDATQFVNNWGKVSFTTATTTLTPSQTSFAHGTNITISGKVTGASATPTGDVALMTDSTEQLQQGQGFFTLSSGSFTSGSINYLPGGKYNIWGRYAGDTVNASSTSTPVAIDVTPEASGVFFNVFTPGEGGVQTVASGTTGIPYGTQLTLSGMPAPSSQLSAFENCELNGGACPSFTEPTGTIAFLDGSTVLDTALINAEGDAEYTIPAGFNVGSHSVTASYPGDNSYNASTAAAITFSVVQSTPEVLITGPFAGSSYTQGQPSTLTVEVESLGNGAAPTGSVTLTGAPAGTPTTANLSAGTDPSYNTSVGTATVIVPASAAVGNYNISATYNPTGASVANYGSATTSSPFALQIAVASGIATTTTASSSASGPLPNAAVTITGTVKAASGAAPIGTVYLYISALSGSSNTTVSELAQATLTAGSGTSSSYSFTLGTSALLVGANQVTVQYLGNTTDAGSAALINIANPLSDFQMVPATTIVPVSAGGSGTVAVNLASTNGFSGAISLSCTGTGVTCTVPSSASISSGGNINVTLTISAASSLANRTYNVVVTGTDSSKEFVHTLGIQAVVTGASAPLETFALSNSGALSFTAGAASGDSATITATPSGGFTGTVTLSCSLTNPPGGITAPTCTIPTSVDITSTTAQTAALAIVTTTATTPGVYTFTVTGKSGTITQTTSVGVTINPVSTPTFALSNSGDISLTAGATTGNTSVISATPSGGFTGTVSLTCSVVAPVGASNAVTCTVPASVDITGTTAVTATLTAASTLSTTAGGYVVTVTGTSASPALTESTTVNVSVSAPVGTYALTNSANISISPGATSGNTSTITVTPSNGFTGAVALTCAFVSNASTDPATCSMSPASVSITSGALTSTLTIGTTAATTSRNEVKKLFWPSTGGVAVAFLLFFLAPKRRRNWLAMLVLLVVFAGLAGMGCGGNGGGSGGGGGGGGNAGTTAGTYSVTVTGTSGSASETTTVTLTVN